MGKSFAKTIVLVALITLVAGCGKSSPTSIPATRTPVPTATPADTPAPMTAERLIDECARAMGGIGKIDSLETMRLAQRWPDHTGLIRYEIKRPNKVRMGDSLVFDGERASWLDGELVPQEEWKDFEMDIAWYVPAFFDYPAEYVGTEIVDNIETYKIQVNLPLGAVVTYSLDAQTYLVYRATSHVTIDGKEYRYERTYSDYRLLDGILYPHAFTYMGRDGVTVLTATMETLEFNVPLGDERFSIPAASEATPTAAPLTFPEGGGVLTFDGGDGLYLMDVAAALDAGSDDRHLLVVNAFGAAWSPDGTQIAFLSKRDGGAEEIYVMDADGGNQRRLTRNDVFDGAPSWSPDSAQLVFASVRDGNHEIYIMDSDGANVKRLTNNSAADRKPAWRPGPTTLSSDVELSGDTGLWPLSTPVEKGHETWDVL